MSKTFALVLVILLVWVVVVKQFKVGEIPQKSASATDTIDSVGTPTPSRTYTT